MSSRRQRQALRFLLGLALLIFAGYAIGLRSTGLSPEHHVLLLGEQRLLAGGPAALRVVGTAPGGGTPLPITAVDVTLVRDGQTEVLARLLPQGAVIDLNLVLPDWPVGPAELRARVDTISGSRTFVVPVELVSPSGLAKRKLRLDRPSLELLRPPVYEAQPAAESRDSGGDGGGAPATFQAYPMGGSLGAAFEARVLVRIADRAGDPVPGKLFLSDGLAGRSDKDGLVAVVVPADDSAPLDLRFEGPSGTLSAKLALARDDTPFSLEVRPRRVAAGGTVEAQIRARAERGQLFFDLWWNGGLCGAAQTSIDGGRAAAVLRVPAGVEGPLIVRVRSDEEGLGDDVRSTAVWVGRREVPSLSLIFAELVQLTPDGSFWAEARHLLTGGRASLMALLSRVRAPDGGLPVLADSRKTEAPAPAGARSTMALFASILTAAASVLFLLVLAWLLLAGRRERKTGLRWAILGLVALIGAGGWLWLWLNSR